MMDLPACPLPLFRQSLLLPSWHSYIYVFGAVIHASKQKKTKTFHHKDLSLPHINKAYDPDLNVPLLLIVLLSHRKKIEKNEERK